MRYLVHDAGFLPPLIVIDLSLPNSPCSGLLQSVLAAIANVPEMCHNAIAPFTNLPPQVDPSPAGCMGPGRQFRVWSLRNVKVTEEVFRCRCALTEPVHLADVLLRVYMLGSDNLKLNGAVYLDKNGCFFFGISIPAHNPSEIASCAAAFSIVCDLGPQ